MFVYCVVNDINGKMYVGKTVRSVKRRMAAHIRGAYGSTRDANSAFHRAIRKYGPAAFSVIVLATATTHEELSELEQHFIQVLKTKKRRGYNLSDGGEGQVGWKPTTKTRIRMSLSKLGNKNAVGVSPGVQTRHKIGEASRKLWDNPDFRAMMAAKRKQRWQDPEHRAKQMASRPAYTEERRQRISAAFREKWKDPEFRARWSAARKGKPHKWTPESLAKQSEMMKRTRATKYWNSHLKPHPQAEAPCS